METSESVEAATSGVYDVLCASEAKVAAAKVTAEDTALDLQRHCVVDSRHLARRSPVRFTFGRVDVAVGFDLDDTWAVFPM